MGNLRFIRKLRIFFGVLFCIEYFLGNHPGASFAMCGYLVTLYFGQDIMERTFVAALEEAESENEKGTGAGVGGVDEPQAGPRKEDEPEGGPR